MFEVFMNSISLKIEKIINSCIFHDQLESARKYFNNAIKNGNISKEEYFLLSELFYNKHKEIYKNMKGCEV